MGKFIYIMGKSASGKDTIAKLLKEKLGLKSYVMYTTRPMRAGEQEGVDYFYTTEDKIEEYRNNGKLIESRTYQTVHGPWTYATVNDSQLEGESDIIGLGTPESFVKVKKFFDEKGSEKLLPVYVEIDEETRRQRAIKREEQQENPKWEEMERRLKADNIDFSEENLKAAGIVDEERFKNYDLDTCINEIISYIMKED